MKKIIYFSAPWCAPCKTFAPIMERVANELGWVVEKIDISTEDGEKIATAEGIKAVPTLILEKGGMWQDQRQGSMSESKFRDWLNSV